MKTDLKVRRAARMSGGALSELRGTNYEALAVAQFEPARAAATAAGLRFVGGNQIIANGIAPVAAIPTTTATLALYNGENAGGRSLFIEQIRFWLGSGTAAAGATLFACVSPTVIATAPSMATGYGVSSASAGGARSAAVFGTAVTVPTSPFTPAWFAVGSSFQAAAANVGQGDGYADIEGGILVPPRHALGLGILSGTGTSPLYGISVIWTELAAELE
jgi:hypothetical protein